MIRLMVARNNGTPEDAKDVFQEGLMVMLEKIDDRDFALTCKFKTYLFCICQNLWKEALDKRMAASRFHKGNPEDDFVADTSEEMDNQVYERIFRSALDSMDPGDKTILQLFWQDLPLQEIADKLGFTYGYTKKKKSEAQAELTDRVKKHPEYRLIMSIV
jgi:RNA polymerase sigma factor (sigma-70 family)